jgi:hypothetical protein
VLLKRKNMSNNKLFQIAGWCALLVALLMVAGIVVPAGAPDIIGLVLTIAVLLGLTFVFYALYVAHRRDSAGLSLAGLVLWILAAGINLIAMFSTISTFLAYMDSLFWLLPFLIFGFLAYQSTGMPRGLAVAAFLAGISLLIATIAGMMGGEAIVNGVSLIADIFMLVWLVWLWRVFRSTKFSAA